MDVYREIAEWIVLNPGTHGAEALTQILLSLFNQDFQVNLYSALSALDPERSALAVEAIQHFASHGETRALVEACKSLPELWD